MQVESVDASFVKRMTLSFEKKVTKNSEMRIKFPDQPEKYALFVNFNASSYSYTLFLKLRGITWIFFYIDWFD